MSYEMESNFPSNTSKHGHQTQGASVGLPNEAPRQLNEPIRYTSARKELEGQAGFLTSLQTFCLGFIAFMSLVIVGLLIGILAMLVKIGSTVYSTSYGDGTLHYIQTST
jgi:hypothetical protein